MNKEFGFMISNPVSFSIESPKVAVSFQIILKQDVYQELYQDYVIQHSPPAT